VSLYPNMDTLDRTTPGNYLGPHEVFLLPHPRFLYPSGLESFPHPYLVRDGVSKDISRTCRPSSFFLTWCIRWLWFQNPLYRSLAMGWSEVSLV
jgi:hypothetical protein